MSKTHPLLLRFVLCVGLPLAVLLLGGYAHLRRSLPLEQGHIQLAGARDTIKIVRDAGGVPHVFARTDRDAWFALGYLHAQDRLWQMESQRRLGQGRLSELLGRSQLATDRFMRTLGLYGIAKANLEHLGPGARASLESYAQGVNAWIGQATVLPVEFQVLGFEPEPWEAHDCLLQIKLMALSLDRNYRDDLTFSLLTKALGDIRANQIRTGSSQPLEATMSAQVALASTRLDSLLALSERMDDRFRLAGAGAGSNAWVVAGKYTSSGLPMLANDPHLKTQIPAIWYLAELRGDKLHVTGATIPGLPLVMTGHNDAIAWGVTALYADTQDIFLERNHPTNDDLYEVDGQWLPVRVEDQLIRVRADFPAWLNDAPEPVTWPVRHTRHGPLISDALGEIDTPMALEWSALKDDDVSYEAFLAINYAQDWPAFCSALERYTSPTLNFLYADRQGNIGQAAAGEIPVRRAGDGSLPVPGWNSQFDWIDTIARADLPRSLNPPAGYIVSANNRIHGADYPYFISRDWAPGYRAERITALISEDIRDGRKLTVASSIRIQGDRFNSQAAQLRELFANVTPANARQRQALEYLQRWDLRSDSDSVAAAIYHTWLRHFSRSILKDAIEADPLHAHRRIDSERLYEELYPEFLDEVVNGALAQWCERLTAPRLESCAERAGEALERALRDLTVIGGKDMRDWQWGKLHAAHYPHGLFNRVKLLDRIFNRSVAKGGDTYTVDVAPAIFSKDHGYRALGGATYRQVIDLGDWNQSRFSIDTGQSGNFVSLHYDDYVQRHAALRPAPMRFGERAAQGKTLLIEPLQNEAAEF